MGKITKDDLAKIVGERLKELRKAKTDIGQKEVAEEIGITKQAMSSYESGRHVPDITVLMELADYYSCSVDYLLGRDKKIVSTAINDSKREIVNNLSYALDTVTEDEGNYIVDGTTSIINALSISKANTERKNFIEYIGELLYLLAEYIEVSTVSGKRLAEQDKQKTLTPEMVTITTAQFFGYDDLYTLMEDIKRTGLKAAIPYSVNAKKVLRIRTGWRNTPQKNSEQKRIVERMIEEVDKESD